MEKRQRIEQLMAMKQRKGRGFSPYRVAIEFDHQLLPLLKDSKFVRVADFAIIRSVTLVEVFTREWVANLIDHGAPYLERAEAVTKSVKFDFLLSSALQGRELSLGEIVAHDISLNSVGQIIGVFEKLLDGDFKNRVAQVKDRWKVEIECKDEGPIIDDIDRVCGELKRLMELRHVVTHELPSTAPYKAHELPSLVDAARRFVVATEEVLNVELNGNYPLTQAAMNLAADEQAAKAEADMQAVLSAIRSREGVDTVRLDASQCAWESYCKAEAELRAGVVEGGSMWPMIYASALAELTLERKKQLLWWREREEGEF